MSLVFHRMGCLEIERCRVRAALRLTAIWCKTRKERSVYLLDSLKQFENGLLNLFIILTRMDTICLHTILTNAIVTWNRSDKVPFVNAFTLHHPKRKWANSTWNFNYMCLRMDPLDTQVMLVQTSGSGVTPRLYSPLVLPVSCSSLLL